MIRLIADIPNKKDGTSMYRAIGPLSEIRNHVDVQVISGIDSYAWSELWLGDILFMQRPYLREHANLAQMAKKNGLPLWIDYDDLLLSVPTDNPAHGRFMTEDVRKNIHRLVQLADVITVSTEPLKAAMELLVDKENNQLAKRVYVVRNALNFRRFQNPMKHRDSSLEIAWRGTPTHERDIRTHLEGFVASMKKHPEAQTHWIGYNPWYIEHALPKQTTYVDPMDPMVFMEYLSAKLNAGIHIVPLHDSAFNRCKSNIAWLEATYAGSICVVPDWYEWRIPGVITYNAKDPADFGNAVETALAMKPEARKELFRESQEIMFAYDLQKANAIRADIVRALTGSSNWPKYEPTPNARAKELFGLEESETEIG